MPAYIIGDIEVLDPQGYEEYRARVPAVIAAHGGKYVVRGGATKPLEGGWVPQRTVVLEFSDMAALEAFWNSDDYVPLRAIREKTARSRIIAVDGYRT